MLNFTIISEYTIQKEKKNKIVHDLVSYVYMCVGHVYWELCAILVFITTVNRDLHIDEYVKNVFGYEILFFIELKEVKFDVVSWIC